MDERESLKEDGHFIVGGASMHLDVICIGLGYLWLAGAAFSGLAAVVNPSGGSWELTTMGVVGGSIMLAYGKFSYRHIFWFREFDIVGKKVTARFRIMDKVFDLGTVQLAQYTGVGYRSRPGGSDGEARYPSSVEFVGNERPYRFGAGPQLCANGKWKAMEDDEAAEQLAKLYEIEFLGKDLPSPGLRLRSLLLER